MYLQSLRDDDLHRIVDAAMTILDTVGIWFTKAPDVVEFLASKGARVEGDRVFFPRKLIEDCLAALPDREGLVFGDPSLGYGAEVSMGRGQSHFAVNGNAASLHDYTTGVIRPAIEADVDDKLLITDHLSHIASDPCDMIFGCVEAVNAMTSVTLRTPGEQDGFMRRWLAGRAGATGKPLTANVRNYSPDQARLAMFAAVIKLGPDVIGTHLGLWEQYMWINPISPLQYHPDQARVLLSLRDTAGPCKMVLLCPEVMLGATSPVTLAGALAQHTAEVLAGMAIVQLARPGIPTMFACVSAPMDLRNAEVNHGGFETALFNAACVQLADHFGMPSRICPGNTSEKVPNTRAAVETAVGVCMGLAAGGNIIMTALLDSTLSMSYEHLIVTDEIIAQMQNINSPIATDAESLAMDVIAEHGHPSASYVTSDHTLRNMNRDIYYSDFTGRVESSYEEWYDKAHRKVNAIFASRNDCLTDPALLDRLASVEARLAEQPDAWLTGRIQDDWWRFYVQDFA